MFVQNQLPISFGTKSLVCKQGIKGFSHRHIPEKDKKI